MAGAQLVDQVAEAQVVVDQGGGSSGGSSGAGSSGGSSGGGESSGRN